MKSSLQMKRLIITFVSAAFLLVAMPFCSDKGGDDGCSEPAMTVVTIPAINSTEPAAPGPDFPLQINITANKPSQGVTIEIKAHPDGSASNFFTSSTSSTSANNSFTITNTPAATTCKVDITITSKSCNTNKWTGSYTYSRK